MALFARGGGNVLLLQSYLWPVSFAELHSAPLLWTSLQWALALVNAALNARAFNRLVGTMVWDWCVVEGIGHRRWH